MKNTYLLGSALALLVLSSCNKIDNVFEHSNDPLNATDKTFLKHTSIGNNAEIQTGLLAAQKATDPAIRAFGQQMVAEHGVAQTDLRALLSNLSYPVGDTLDAPNKALLMQLDRLSGRAFDSVYINHAVEDHQKDDNLYKTELDNGKNREVKEYADRYQPRIRAHLQEATIIAQRY